MNPSEFDILYNRVQNVLAKNIFFVCGTPKSGTTWLQKALDAHPEIMCSGEGHFINSLGHMLNHLVIKYNEVLKKISNEVYEGETYYNYLGASELKFLASILSGLIMGSRDIPDSVKFIGDKTPANALHIDKLHELFPKAKFIIIVRDGRDVLASTIGLEKRIKGQDHEIDMEKATKIIADRWFNYNNSALEFSKQNPGLCHFVRYEDMSMDFKTALINIMNFMGADASDGVITKCQNESSFKKLSGGRARGEENIKSFYRKGIVGDWKNYLDKDNSDLFKKICSPILRKFNYDG